MEKQIRNNLVKKVCPNCGHKFTVDDLVTPLLNFQQMFGYVYKDFYGGNVKKFTKVKCKCGQHYYLYWNKNSNCYYVKDIEPYGEKPEKKKKVNVDKVPPAKEETKVPPIEEEPPKAHTPLPLVAVGQFAKLTNREMYLYLKKKYGADVNNKMSKEVYQAIHKKYMGISKSTTPKFKAAAEDTLDKTVASEAIK